MRFALERMGLFCAAVLLATAVGCDTWLDQINVLPGGSDATFYEAQEAEPNDAFEQASEAPATVEVSPDISGSITSDGDIDIYDLGPVTAGQRITVSFECTADLAAALFDQQQRLISTNDDRWWQTDTRPELAVTVRRDCEHCYLAVSASPAATGEQGTYTATVLLEESSVPAARSQVIYLQFAGASDVMLPDGTMADIPAFDPARIDSSFAGTQATMVAAIVDYVRTDFDRFNVQVLASSETSVVPKDATIVYFGLYSPELLGLADNVDAYNVDLTQTAIVFADTFRLFMPLEPTLEEMALALANVASHEAGHLLGLEHTDDWDDLMDTTAPATSLMLDQDFREASLYAAVFPIGLQDGALLLGETLGVRQPNAGSIIDRTLDFANTVGSADNRPSDSAGAAPSSDVQAAVAGVSPEVWRLLLHSQRSGQGYVSKDLFAVHSRRSHSR